MGTTAVCTMFLKRPTDGSMSSAMMQNTQWLTHKKCQDTVHTKSHCDKDTQSSSHNVFILIALIQPISSKVAISASRP